MNVVCFKVVCYECGCYECGLLSTGLTDLHMGDNNVQKNFVQFNNDFSGLVVELRMFLQCTFQGFFYRVSAQAWVKCFYICRHNVKHSYLLSSFSSFRQAVFPIEQVYDILAAVLAKFIWAVSAKVCTYRSVILSLCFSFILIFTDKWFFIARWLFTLFLFIR